MSILGYKTKTEIVDPHCPYTRAQLVSGNGLGKTSLLRSSHRLQMAVEGGTKETALENFTATSIRSIVNIGSFSSKSRIASLDSSYVIPSHYFGRNSKLLPDDTLIFPCNTIQFLVKQVKQSS